jgi:hypothetical protein
MMAAVRIARLRELRDKREDAEERFESAVDEWDTQSQVEERITLAQVPEPPKAAKPWLTPERAKAIALGSVTVGGAIFGFLQRMGAFK